MRACATSDAPWRQIKCNSSPSRGQSVSSARTRWHWEPRGTGTGVLAISAVGLRNGPCSLSEASVPASSLEKDNLCALHRSLNAEEVGLCTSLRWTVLEVGSIFPTRHWCASSGWGRTRPPPPNAKALRVQSAYFWEHPSCRAAILCQVELATSEVRTSGVPSTTFAMAFSTAG